LIFPFSTLTPFSGACCWALWAAFCSGKPGRFQAAVEMLVEMVDAQAKGIVHSANSRKLVAPLALTVFVWIFLLNAMDMLPVDLLPWIWERIFGAAGHDPHHAYMRSVPTADLSITMALSLGVLIVCLVYNVKMKGVGGWVHELFSAPFGAHPLLWLPNFAMQIIALLGGGWTLSAGGLGLAALHIVAGTAWSIFHILIIVLQAFVFMMLTLVYIGQAHDAH
jgi:F-type H+-transporting ATPase subunit a